MRGQIELNIRKLRKTSVRVQGTFGILKENKKIQTFARVSQWWSVRKYLEAYVNEEYICRKNDIYNYILY